MSVKNGNISTKQHNSQCDFFRVEISSTPIKSSKIGNKKKEYCCNKPCMFCDIKSKAASVFQKILFIPETMLAVSSIIIQCKCCPSVFSEVVATKSDMLQNYSMLYCLSKILFKGEIRFFLYPAGKTVSNSSLS